MASLPQASGAEASKLRLVEVPGGETRSAATIPASLGLPPSFTAHDLLTDERYQWRIGRNYVRLEPGVRQAHVVRVES